ncbi:MAG: hypothetical protein A3J24_07015 [Deltaproteobacteria bacterium RIFCSPLOWO2_02_FULL_53_8]|nr:MAG: hypothetical protein A3J24_07015 [Deltaproteobacteria bacterium RIFCSPLOWO2_02_FULL_53_8]
MPTNKTCYKVVLASPSDVTTEREAVDSVIAGINNIKKSKNICYDLYRWETDSYPTFHAKGPQGVIDEALKIEDAHIFIGIFHTRFGTPVLDSDSGTEHEIKQAIKTWEEKQSPEIKLYFKNAAVNPYELNFAQFEKVKNFRESVMSDGILCDFTTTEEFKTELNTHLHKYIDDAEAAPPVASLAPSSAPTPQTSTARPLIPKPSPIFTGRTKELADFNNIIKSSNTLVIEGLGGIGKTDFAAMCLKELPPEKLVWFDCLPESTIDALIDASGFPDLLKGEQKTDLAKHVGYISLIERDGLTILLDNFHDLANDSLIEFFKYAENRLENARIIILSRVHPKELLQTANIKLIGLEADAFDYAKKILAHYHNVTPDDFNIKVICKRLKGHPFAILHAMRLLSYGDVTPDEIIEHIIRPDDPDDALSKRLLGAVFDHPRSTEDEKQLLLNSSVFRSRIERAAFTNISNGKDITNALHRLMDKQMVTLLNGLYETHPLVREFCYERLEDKVTTHLIAADFFKQKRQTMIDPSIEEEIFHHLYSGNALYGAADLVVEEGEGLILAGHTSVLKDMIEKLTALKIERSKFHLYLGDIAQIRGEWDTAKTNYEKAFTSNDKGDSAIEAWIKYGEILFKKGLVEEAKGYFDDAYSTCNKNTDLQKMKARVLNNIGLICKHFGDYLGAETKMTEAFAIQQLIKDYVGEATTLNDIGGIYLSQSNLPKALTKHKEALKISKEKDDKNGQANALNSIGSVYKTQGNLSEALTKYEEALKISTEIGNKKSIAATLNNIGLVYMTQDSCPEALVKYEEALKIFNEIGDRSGQAATINNIGLLYKAQKKLPEALIMLNKSLKIRKDISNKKDQAATLNNIGSVYKAQGVPLDALKKFKESLKIHKDIGNMEGQANNLHNIGSVYKDQKKLRDALIKFKESLKIRIEIGNRDGQANNHHNIGTIYLKQGKRKDAITSLFLSLAMQNEIGLSEKRKRITKDFIFNVKNTVGPKNFQIIAQESFNALPQDLQPHLPLSELTSNKTIQPQKKVNMNALCPCGSGKEQKDCCDAH